MQVYIVGIPYEVEIGYVVGKDMGSIDHVKQKIVIDRDLDYDSTVETLLHEVLHGIEYAFGMDLPDKDIERMARGLYSVLEDPQNEFFWAALAGSDEIMEENDDMDDLFADDEEMVEANPADYTRSHSGFVPQSVCSTPEEEHQQSGGSGDDTDRAERGTYREQFGV